MKIIMRPDMTQTNKEYNIIKSIRYELKIQRSNMSEEYIKNESKKIQKILSDWLESILYMISISLELKKKIKIAAFLSIKQEPIIMDLLESLSARDDVSICLPSIDKIDSPLSFKIWRKGDKLKLGEHNILEPVLENYIIPNIILIPTLGFTKDGDRIGYGKGYYDRTLSELIRKHHKFLSIGISWDCGIIRDYRYRPANHDVKLDGIITSSGWIKKPSKDIEEIL